MRFLVACKHFKALYGDFQFSLWDSQKSLKKLMRKVFILSFNSLYEIQRVMKMSIKNFAILLSILFMRFHWIIYSPQEREILSFNSLYEILWQFVMERVVNGFRFQFSLWDSLVCSTKTKDKTHWYFQFSLWDSSRLVVSGWPHSF